MLIAETAYAASSFYVSPVGLASGDGSINSPWNLQTALNHPSVVQPGDTIWLRGGTYKGTFISKLKGTSGAPIVVRQYPGERVVIDRGEQRINPAALTVDGTYSWFWGIEIANSNTTRTIGTAGSNPDNGRASGVTVNGKNNKFINLIIHDNGSGFGAWATALDTEIYGSLIYNNGWYGPDRGHGHAIYAQNRYGVKKIEDNIMMNQGSHGLHVYGSGDASYLNGFQVEGNIAFSLERGYLIGGGITCKDIRFKNNVAYYPVGSERQAFNLGYIRGCENGVVEGNYLAGVTKLVANKNLSMTGNTFAGAVSFEYTNTPSNTLSGYAGNTHITYNTRPTSNHVFIRPNKYEKGRGHVAIFNWENKNEVAVDLSTVLSQGDKYEIRDAQNYFGPAVVSGTYTGGSVNIPLGQTAVSAPNGNFPMPVHTSKEFGVFVVMLQGSVATVPPPPVVVPPPTPTPVPTPVPTPTPTPTPVPTPTPTSTPTPTTFDMRIRAGLSTPYTGSDGKVWNGNSAYTTNAILYRVSNATTNTTEPELFKAQSFFPQSGEYKISVPKGKYTVRLHFAELYFNQKGSRVFDVSLEGVKVLQDFDVFESSGGQFKAITKEFQTTVQDGVLNILLSKVIENPIINGIEIIKTAEISSGVSDTNSWLAELYRKLEILRTALERSRGTDQLALPLCEMVDCSL